MGVTVFPMADSLHYPPVRTQHQYRDQYAPKFEPYTSAPTYPGGEANKYKHGYENLSKAEYLQATPTFAARGTEHGNDFYNHRPNEVGFTTGPYAGPDARHSGFDPAPHFFNSGYNQVPEAGIELRRPFCGMTTSRTQKCSPLQESIRLMHTQRRNNHEFTPRPHEEHHMQSESFTLPVHPTGMYFSHAQARQVGDKLTFFGGDKYGGHAYAHYPHYSSATPTVNPMWDSPRLEMEARAFRDETRGGQFDAPRWDDVRAGRCERNGMKRKGLETTAKDEPLYKAPEAPHATA